MSDWEIYCWNEDNFSIKDSPDYVKEAYSASKYAFVSDYIRLWALEQYGGVYFDTDVEVIKSLNPLLSNIAFIGFEESLAHLPGTCVMGCEAHCLWIKQMLGIYEKIHFVTKEKTYDFTTNVQRMGQVMIEGGLVANGKEQIVERWDLHVYPHDFFSPITSTRVMRKSKNTYCIHHFAGSWGNTVGKCYQHNVVYLEIRNFLIQIKRKIKRIK